MKANFRDITKDPVNKEGDFYEQPILEISPLTSALTDEALLVLRYIIELQRSEADNKKPWIWMERLRLLYTGTLEAP